MKIQIRRRPASPKTGPVRVREKTIYSCRECGNKYYSCYFFCPQCLGEVVSASAQSAVLQIVSSDADALSAAELFKKFSENQQFDFEKAFQSLPWNCMLESDPAILQRWKECLEAQKIRAEILSGTPPAAKKRKKPYPPLYLSNAPFPRFFPSSLSHDVRKIARVIPIAGARLQWAETVLLAFNIVEGLYKHQTGMILFYDIILKIEQELRGMTESYEPRWSEQRFLKRLQNLRDSLDRMAAEIQEVRDQVQERL